MVLGKLPVPGRPKSWMIIGQGPIMWTSLLYAIFSLLFLPLSGRRPDID